ncbi:hypothetical protein CK203_072033 [Vitis vinifera]|uniref:Neprosin PEP catalytic domain-containing protein n=1 Tax=Vitis vinifera TaxID=29760 RepID=A0A438EXD8_VITVI|nr:hypothetical protein CK203_072033 [Vitis vinifera]
MFEDKESTNWWLLVQAEPVGYWTTTLFTSLSHRAEALAWGGKVINSAHMGAHGQHTQTDMGSGHFLTMGNLRASFIRGCPNPRRLEVRRPSYVKSQTHIPNQLGVVSSFSNQAKARKMDHYIDRASTSMNKMHSEKGVIHTTTLSENIRTTRSKSWSLDQLGREKSAMGDDHGSPFSH